MDYRVVSNEAFRGGKIICFPSGIALLKDQNEAAKHFPENLQSLLQMWPDEKQQLWLGIPSLQQSQ